MIQLTAHFGPAILLRPFPVRLALNPNLRLPEHELAPDWPSTSLRWPTGRFPFLHIHIAFFRSERLPLSSVHG